MTEQNKSPPAHTPTPWLADNARDAEGVCTIIRADNGDAIALLSTFGYAQVDIANGAFIVRACNSHYELREAAQDVIAKWASSDLAAAVRALDAAVCKARRAP